MYCRPGVEEVEVEDEYDTREDEYLNMHGVNSMAYDSVYPGLHYW